ncbi:MAG: amidohydrolase family protein [Defluviitaleaceae bacterium]|nr:amidohydrolase family protein [Defluviitaleaceae bacterium]
MTNFNNVYERLLNYADNMQIIDTHEHLTPHKNYLGDEPDVLNDYFSHYISSDLQSAGMPEAYWEKSSDYKIDIIDRFKMLEPYMNCVKNTSYYRSLEISARKIHKVDEISIHTIEELNARFKKAASQADYGRYIMKDLCHIEVSINDNWADDMRWSTTDLFVPAWQPGFYMNYPVEGTAKIEIPIEKLTLNEYCEHFRKYFIKQIADGAKALKFPVAYWRSLYFEDVDYETANALYNDAIKTNNAKTAFPKKLQDYIMHFILKVADEHGFVIQIHTGLQEGMGNNLENSSPMLLLNLFDKYPNATFDLFHTGYPYERELAVLAKTHANVYVDFCWSHLISPFAAKNAFYEMLDVLPYTKIFGFGGDYLFFDGVVGHLTMAKQNICTVLAQKIMNDECDMGLAEGILQAVLYDNAKRVFKL